MSYARFGADGSGVYVYTSSTGIECCGCTLQGREWIDDPDLLLFLRDVGEHIQTVFTTNAGMTEHLEAHRAAGHVVPQHAFDRLNDPEDAAENERIWRARAEVTP
jgi:hypothetical protein